MKNQHDIPKAVYHGKWSVPQRNSIMLCGKLLYKPYMGTLYYYGNKESVLELYFEPPLSNESLDGNIDVIHGFDTKKTNFSVFNAKSGRDDGDFKKWVIKSNAVVIGYEPKPVHSLDEELYSHCFVEYPYLRNWAFKDVFNKPTQNGFSWDISKGLDFEVEVEDGVKLAICSCTIPSKTDWSLTVEQTTKLMFVSEKPLSINKFNSLITILSRFLSVATFSLQSPTEVSFKRKNAAYPWLREQLLMPQGRITQPQGVVIKYDGIVEKNPSIIRKWFDNYEQLAPIAKYLVQAVAEQKDEYDAPDFLIIAQALDGYFKRFINKKNGKNVKQYEHQLKELLKRFAKVRVLKKCYFDATKFAHSRNKYSHLIPDNETKNVEKAVEGEELFYLTQKGIVLLTCCILDSLVLSIEDINTCLNGSILESMIDNMPPQYLYPEDMF